MMKKFFFTIIIVVLFASKTWSLTFMGPTTSYLEAGQSGIGFNYSNSEMDIRFEGYGLNAAIGMEVNAYFAKLLFGISDGSEISLHFGISNIEEDVQNDFSSSKEFTWGLGAKMKFGETDPLEWGAAFRLTSFTGDDTDMVGPYLVKGEFDVVEIQIVLGPTYRIDRLCVYGGPMLHFIQGDLDGGGALSGYSFDIEQESEFGGYIGLGLQFAKNISLNVEYQSTGDAHAVGFSLLSKFGDLPKRITPTKE